MSLISRIGKGILTAFVFAGVLGGSLLFGSGDTVVYADSIVNLAPVNIPADMRAQMSGVENATFDILRSCIADVAAGRRTDTVFQVPVSALGLGSATWNAADLGVSTIAVNGVVTEEAKNAAVRKVTGNIDIVIDALLADCPMELFWYDKNPGVGIGCTITSSYSASNQEYRLSISGNITYYFDVESAFASSQYHVNPAYIARAQSAANNARAIVSRYANLSDYEKIVAYRNEICNLVTYDTAASNAVYGYGDPWQLVNVFDGNPSTNVVCEGYSKALKYLCDMTTFNSGLVSCIIVSGTISAANESGNHMWNVIRMDDGRNYLVDLTNYDESYFSLPDKMFLSSYDGGSYPGYIYNVGNTNVSFSYNADTMSVYNSSALTLSNAPYVPTAGGYAPAAPVNVEGASGFIERLYTVALGRTSDPVGAQYWLDKVTSGYSTGADLARGFLYSDEFLGKNMSNDDFLTVLYRTFFDREADPAGRAYWNARLESGMTRQQVVDGFINSVEWYNLCSSYGIRSGSAAAPAGR